MNLLAGISAGTSSATSLDIGSEPFGAFSAFAPDARRKPTLRARVRVVSRLCAKVLGHGLEHVAPHAGEVRERGVEEGLLLHDHL
jgi:hypothetical protein